MDSAGLEDLLRGDVPATDAAARDRARLRLMAVMVDEPRQAAPAPKMKHPWLLPAVAACMALALLLVEIVLPPGGGGPSESAAAEIRRLGDLASRQAPLPAGRAEFVYQQMEVQTREFNTGVTSSSSFALDVRTNVESWLAPDGSGRVETRYEAVSFASDQDRVAWEMAGKPSIPVAGELVVEPYDESGLPHYAVRGLPTDPIDLRSELLDGSVIEPAPGDLNLLSTIGTLLSQEDVPSDLRGALFDVAASIPNVIVEHDLLDPMGRHAVAVRFDDESGTTRLYFDPADARFLGRSETFPSEGYRAGVVDWRVFTARGVAVDAGKRPS